MPQRFPVDEFHDDEPAPVLLANVVDRANPRMIQRRRSARLASKPFERLRLLRQFVGEKFQRHRAVQPAILRLVDHAHSAGAQLLHYSIV